MKEKLRYALILPLVLVTIMLSSCGHTLKSESGLYTVELESSLKCPVKGIWFSGTAKNNHAGKRQRFYVAPLNVRAIEKENPEAAQEMQHMLGGFIREYLGKSLQEANKANHLDWQLTDNPAEADIRIDMAIVAFNRQRPYLRIFSDIASNWSPVPMTASLLSPLSAGDICMELTVRSAGNHELLMAVKDANPGKPRYYRSEAYSDNGNAIAGLRLWSQKLARVIRAAAPDRSNGKTMKQRLEELNWLDALDLRRKNVQDDILG